MKYYLAVITRAGEGYDYTTDCNKDVKIYNTEDEKQIITHILNDYGQNNLDVENPIPKIESVEIYEISEQYQSFTGLDKIYMDQHEKFMEHKKTEEEKAKYEELKKKFEDKTDDK